MKPKLAASTLAFAALVAGAAEGATGVCDSNPPTSTQACITAIQNAGGVVNDIFKDAQGRTGPQLPLFASLYDNWPGCTTSHAGCAGEDTPPYDCTGQYTCNAAITNTFQNAATYLAGLDHKWWHPARSSTHGLDANGCPIRTVIADGVGGAYFPWEGLVFDLGGPSNQVAIFATNDHGPQPCESIEYTVFLSDNPLSQEIIQAPTTLGADPQKWNRAVLKKIFTSGWYNTRSPDPAGHAACGDTAEYAVEQDSFAQVFFMPCGITFRYAAIVAGYDGQDFPECAFDSNEAELDAVAGLTENGSGVCPDSDRDGFVDCNCPGAPSVCDCNDADGAVHPGAPEACDSMDVNCDGMPGACAVGKLCVDSVCLPPCGSGEFICPSGSTCQATGAGAACVPNDCTVGSCPPGSVCDPASKTCKPACDGVVCPYGQNCRDGECIDPCKSIQCPSPQTCQLGECRAPCSCFAADAGCTAQPGTVCDRAGTDQCVPSACVGKTCAAGEHCDDQGMCVGLCAGVVCPQNQKCDAAAGGCVSNCYGVTCSSGQVCNEATGQCQDNSCDEVVCLAPLVCQSGTCVMPEGGAGSGGADGGVDGGAGGPPRGSTDAGDDSSCGCHVVAPSRSLITLLGLIGLLGLALRRRRTR